MRGQAAMEFIATYGWAIMVVLMAIGALVYFGVVDVDMFKPEKCVVSSGFVCSDFQLSKHTVGVTRGEITFTLINGLGQPIIIQAETLNFTTPHTPMTTPNACGDNTACPVINWDDGSGENIRTNGVGAKDYTWASDKKILIETNPGVAKVIDFPEAGKREIVKFQFDYKFAGKPFIHHAEGEIYTTIIVQS